MNLYTNQPITASITATIFKGTLQVDSGTASNGVWSTTKSDFQSGASYVVYVVSGNSKYEFNVQVPNAQNATQQFFPITLNMALIGSYLIGVLAPDGVTAITSSYNSTIGGCRPTCKFTITISNNIDNTGLTGSFSRTEVQGRTLTANALIVTTTQGTKTQKPQIVTLPDHAADKQRNPDGTLNLQGKTSQTITIDTSNLSAGASEQITVQYVVYLDTAYFNANGVLNSEAYVAGAFTFQLSS